MGLDIGMEIIRIILKNNYLRKYRLCTSIWDTFSYTRHLREELHKVPLSLITE